MIIRVFMQRYLVYFLICGGFLLSTNSVFSQKKEVRKVESFYKIAVGSGIDLILTHGDENKLTVEADGDKIFKIITVVKDSVLKIYTNGRLGWSLGQSPKVYVSFVNVVEINCGGGSDVVCTNPIKTELLTIKSSGGADIYLELEANLLKLYSNSGADLKVRGTATTLFAEADEGSHIRAKDLVAQSVKATAAGGSEVSIQALINLVAHSDSGSEIYYYGTPQTIDLLKTSGGDITPK